MVRQNKLKTTEKTTVSQIYNTDVNHKLKKDTLLYICTKSNLKLNKPRVEASVDMADPAARTIALDAKLEAAKLGIGKINILQFVNRLEFGRYNNRPLKESEVNKMIMLYEKHRMQWTKSENSLAIVIKPTCLVPE
jgi:hypothetical protein